LISTLKLTVNASSTADYIPYVPCKWTFKKEVIYAFILPTKETIGRVIPSSIEKNISREDALPENHPEKRFDSQWDFNLPKKLVWDSAT
jgi:hypothetical protein